MNSTHKHKIISLFSGCGGTDLGFLGDFTTLDKHYIALPFEVVWANDIEPQACITYERNLGDHITCGDIWDLDISTLPEGDIVIGGFPCQDFSVAGLRKGFDSKRGRLYTAMKDVIERVKPKMFLAENVKGLLSIADGMAIDKIKKDLLVLVILWNIT